MPHDHDDLLARADAVARMLDAREALRSTLGTESVPLEAVAGRTLAEPVVAPADRPPHTFATMDGFAFDATDDYPLTLRDEVFPEDDPPRIADGEAVRIATGAPLPPGANAVLKVEEATVEGDRLRGPSIEPGTYAYERGSNVREGEELFAAGERLSPKDALLLGDLGLETVTVHRRLSVGLLATGTEIHEGRHRDLDSPMLAGLVRSWGHDPTYEGSVPDDYDRVRDRIASLADAHDVLVTTGGTSVGKKDHVVRALADLGEVEFHRVRLRPGKPLALARLPAQDALAVAVPGKPVGAHAVTTLVARPLFTGRTRLPTVPARLQRDVGLGAEGFEYAVPVVLGDSQPRAGSGGSTTDGDGSAAAGDDAPTAMPLGHVDSPLPVYAETFDPSVLSSSTRASRADGFVLTETALEAGTTVRVVPYTAVE